MIQFLQSFPRSVTVIIVTVICVTVSVDCKFKFLRSIEGSVKNKNKHSPCFPTHPPQILWDFWHHNFMFVWFGTITSIGTIPNKFGNSSSNAFIGLFLLILQLLPIVVQFFFSCFCLWKRLLTHNTWNS